MQEFHFSFISCNPKAFTHSDARMNLDETIRHLVKQARTTPPRVSLKQIAAATDVDYHKLWRFLNPRHPDILNPAEAQAIYELLSGKPLLPDTDAL